MRGCNDSQITPWGWKVRGSASIKDLEWIVPALRELRSRYKGRNKECMAETGLSKEQVSYWITMEGRPGRKAVEDFRRACQRIGIPVPEAQG